MLIILHLQLISISFLTIFFTTAVARGLTDYIIAFDNFL